MAHEKRVDSGQAEGRGMLTFPFGMPITPVRQADTSPKRIFVLGVYASAVHARWVTDDDKTIISALAVASEPEIFWRGNDAGAIIGQIPVPPGAGRLVSAGATLNGPSGVALDSMFLEPLGITRQDAWLSDLLPESRCNPRRPRDQVRVALIPDRLPAGIHPEYGDKAVCVRVVDDLRRLVEHQRVFLRLCQLFISNCRSVAQHTSL